MATTEPNLRLVMAGRRVAGSTTLEMIYDSTHCPVSGNTPDNQPGPDYDFIRKQRIEQDLSEGDKS